MAASNRPVAGAGTSASHEPKGQGNGHSTKGGAAADGWPTLTQAADSLFNVFDSNDDGTIAVSEISAVLDPGGHHPEQLNAVVRRLIDVIDADDNAALTAAEVSDAIAQLDTNEDGALSPADLSAALAIQGLAPLLAQLLQGAPVPGAQGHPASPPVKPPIAPVPVPLPPVVPGPPEPRDPPSLPDRPHAPTVAQVVDTLQMRFDADDDGSISLAELLAVLDPNGKRAKIQEAMASLLHAVDTDGDHSMSAPEITAAVATLDADDNGLLDHRDHVPGPPGDDAVDLIGLLLPRLREFDIASLGHFG